MRIAIGADTNTRELSQVPPERQTLRQQATRHLMQAMMARARRGQPSLGLHDLSDQRLCLGRRDEPRRLRGLLLPRLPGDGRRPARRLEAGLGGMPPPLPSGSRATRRCGSSPTGTDLRLGIAGRHFIPCDGDHNMPDGEFFTGPIEDSVEGEVTFSLPSVIGGREVAGVRLRFEAGKVVDASATARRGVPDQAARHRRGRRAASASSGSAPTTASTAGPRTSFSTRRSAARSILPSAPAIPSRAASTRARCTRTWSATCATAGASKSTASCFSRTGASRFEL